MLLALAVWALFWALKNGQFDDLESHGWSVVLDDDQKPPPEVKDEPFQEDFNHFIDDDSEEEVDLGDEDELDNISSYGESSDSEYQQPKKRQKRSNVQPQKHEKSRVECDICGKMVAVSVLPEHVAYHKRLDERRESIGRFNDRVSCWECGKKIFHNSNNVRSHYKKIHGDLKTKLWDILGDRRRIKLKRV